jgi:hypothetical protein
MARDAADSAGRDGTVLDDLPDDVWQSLLRGDAAGHWWLEEGAQPVGPDFVLDKQAFEDGKRIGEAVSVLISADLADYSNDEKHYNRQMSSTPGMERVWSCTPTSWDRPGPAPAFVDARAAREDTR